GPAMCPGVPDRGPPGLAGLAVDPVAPGVAFGPRWRAVRLGAVLPRLPAVHHHGCPGHGPGRGGVARVPALLARRRAPTARRLGCLPGPGRGDEGARGIARGAAA